MLRRRSFLGTRKIAVTGGSRIQPTTAPSLATLSVAPPSDQQCTSYCWPKWIARFVDGETLVEPVVRMSFSLVLVLLCFVIIYKLS